MIIAFPQHSTRPKKKKKKQAEKNGAEGQQHIRKQIKAYKSHKERKSAYPR